MTKQIYTSTIRRYSFVILYYYFLSLLSPCTTGQPMLHCESDIGRYTARKSVYRVGVLANRGLEIAEQELKLTFSDYLTATVGPKFDPPISFEMVPVPFVGPVEEYLKGEYDFAYCNPGIFSCMDAEIGMNALATVITKRNVQGIEYSLTQFAGVIITWAGNNEINDVPDLKDKRVGLISMAGLGSGQMQFRKMIQAGLHHLQDPKQLIFLESQNTIVDYVLKKEIDVGFVRTDQLERYIDPETGGPIDLSKFKIIGRFDGDLTSDGEEFPFPRSTVLYPEWPLASYPNVEEIVQREVQTSMLELAERASVALPLMECYEQKNCTTIDCENDCYYTVASPDSNDTCGNDPDTAFLAYRAETNGKYNGWRLPLSYTTIRNMQTEIGYIQYDNGGFQCIRGLELADSIVCPEGHFKKNDADIDASCEQAGLPCGDFNCICKPCVKAHDVDFYPVALSDSFGMFNQPKDQTGCDKFEVCGGVQQNHIIKFYALDNRKREGAVLIAKIRIGGDILEFPFTAVNKRLSNNDIVEDKEFKYEFDFDATGQRPGFLIVEVLVDGEQIPESPFRLEIEPRDCPSDTGDYLREADSTGNCICANSAIEFGSKCHPLSVIIPSILAPVLFVTGVFLLCYLSHRKRMADLLWKVKEEELSFQSPPQILGRGKFGLVFLGEYRGTKVAVKRVLTTRDHTTFGASSGQVANVIDTITGGQFIPVVYNRKSAKAQLGSQTSGSQINAFLAANPYDESETEADIEIGLKSGYYIPPSNRLPDSLGSGGSSKDTKPTRKRKSSSSKTNFAKEMRLLSQLRHPCITTVMGAVVLPHNQSMLVMEFMELGSLRDVLHSDTMVVDDTQVLSMVEDVAKGIRFLHSANPSIIHGDLKAQNVLVDSNFRAKVSDFGLSRTNRYKGAASGTPFWMAPELLRGESGNTTMSDIYSFGILLYEAYSRSYPYKGEEDQEVLRLVADKEINKRPPIPARCPPDVAEVMESCFLGDPEKRPTAGEVDTKLTTASDAHGKSQGLLWQLFPRHIAAKLRDGHKVEPETHENVTVFVCEIIDFSNLKVSLAPIKLSALLDRLYAKFDSLCALHNVFRIETAGDSFMCVTNLAEEQHDHVRIMAAFAIDSLKAAACTLIDDENPSSGHVRIRVGLHTGSVVSHVVGSKTPRYSIIGETVTIAEKLMEFSPERILCSDVSAALLQKQDPDAELLLRGKLDYGDNKSMVTYWVGRTMLSTSERNAPSDLLGPDSENILAIASSLSHSRFPKRHTHLIEWNVDVLHRIIREIVAARDTSLLNGKTRDFSHLLTSAEGRTVFDEVKEVVELPPFDAAAVQRMKERHNVTLPANILAQLRDFVTAISQMYRDVPFHNFEHASHVTLSIVRLLTRIKAVPTEEDEDSESANKTLHQCSYGIASDPVTQLAIVFSALIHDTDHQGVPNAQLVKEESDLAKHYKNRSVAEQNSVDLAWALFMDAKYSDLRSAIAQTEEEISRFRQLVINSVMATDIVDKELKQLRNGRWEKAFSGEIPESGNGAADAVNRKATIVIEHMLQASDIAHTMQQWHVYRKWNERFFRECYAAYKAGRAETDPSKGWYKGELGFFDFYIIPLAKKLQESGVFGVYGDEYVKNAQANRDEWEKSGELVVNEMLSKVQGKNRSVMFS